MDASWKERWDLEEDAHPCNPTDNPTFASVLAARLSRRSFLKEANASLVMFGVGSRHGPRNARAQSSGGFVPVSSSSEDKLITPPGYAHTVLLRWGDPLAAGVPHLDPMAQTATRQAQQFGYNCDFIGYLPLPQDSHSSTRGLLGVNHESTVTALMVPGWDGKPESTTLEMVDIGIAAHGFSIVEVVRESGGGWTYVRDSAFNRRITGATPMTLGGPAAGHPLMRTSADPSGLTVLGTLNNCAGGVTPWGTVLTGEENIWLYFTGKVDDVPDEALRRLHTRYRLGTGRYVWGRYHDRFDLRQEPHEPNRFGWVVEIDPYDPKSVAVKHTAMGRMAHEGATKMDRPEDVEPNPVTGKVYCVTTGNDQRTAAQVDKANPRANNKFGHIIELSEDGGEHTATIFRWEIFFVVVLALLAAPLAAGAPPVGKVWRIGVLMGRTSPESPRGASFRQGLRALEYVEGQNIAFEWRLSGGQAERLPDLAAELVRLKVDVIVAGDNPAIAAAQNATRTIPIVMVLAMDPVHTGFVDSLRRPGGNTTGLTTQATDLQGKALQLLKDAVPTASRVAVLWDPTEPGRRVQATEAEGAARALGLEVQLLEARSPAELDSLFTAMVRERVDAVLVQPSQMIGAHRARLAALAAKSRLPTMGVVPWWSEAGGLMSYAARDIDQFQRAAYYVDKLLRGTQAADLPVEQPMKFQLIINLKTATTLGLTIPPTLLFQADEVIQ